MYGRQKDSLLNPKVKMGEGIETEVEGELIEIYCPRGGN